MIVGIVGKTNVGKSTFFKAATLAEVEISNRPFTTIKPNKGIGFVRVECPEKFFNTKCNAQNSFCINGNRFAPIEMLDVAGLVPGAHLGKGLGNQFLDDLMGADAFIHVLDISGTTDESGNPTSKYDPLYDVKFLAEEIDQWVLGILNKNWEKMSREIIVEKKVIEKEFAAQLSGLKINIDHVVSALKECELEKKDIRQWRDVDKFDFASALRKMSKPMVIACNKIDMPSSAENLERLKRTYPDTIAVPCCAEAELALREAAAKNIIEYVPGDSDFKIIGQIGESQRKALNFIKTKILDVFGSTGIQQCINEVALNLLAGVVVFPVEDENKLSNKRGAVLPDAILMERDSTALSLAAKVHTSLAQGFIKALDCRTKRLLGKDYKLKNGDVVKIVV